MFLSTVALQLGDVKKYSYYLSILALAAIFMRVVWVVDVVEEVEGTWTEQRGGVGLIICTAYIYYTSESMLSVYLQTLCPRLSIK